MVRLVTILGIMARPLTIETDASVLTKIVLRENASWDSQKSCPQGRSSVVIASSSIVAVPDTVTVLSSSFLPWGGGAFESFPFFRGHRRTSDFNHLGCDYETTAA